MSSFKYNKLMAVVITTAISMFLFFSGCTPSERQVEHPDFSRLPSEEEVDHTVDLSVPNNEPLPELFDPDSLEYIATIGNFESLDSRDFYGAPRIRSMDLDPEGNLYISQFHTNSINVYDSNGDYLYTVGGEGRGPGEFQVLVGFAFSEDYQTLYGLGFFEIEVFELKEGHYEPKTTVLTGFTQTYDLCVLGDELFVSGYRPSPDDTTEFVDERERIVRGRVAPPITRFDREILEPGASFGYEYPSVSGFGNIDGRLSRMALSCNETSGTVVGYQWDFPFLFGYDREGGLKWTSRIDGIIPALYIEFVRSLPAWPGLTRYQNETVYQMKFPLTNTDITEYELFQYIDVKPSNPGGDYDPLPFQDLNFRTVLLNTTTGEMTHSYAYDRISLIKGGRVVMMEREPETFQRIFHIYEY